MKEENLGEFVQKENNRENICDICGEKINNPLNVSEPECGMCFGGCSEPSYHRGEPCDRSC